MEILQTHSMLAWHPIPNYQIFFSEK